MYHTSHCNQNTQTSKPIQRPAALPTKIGKHVDKLVLQTNYLPKVLGQGEINWTAKHCTGWAVASPPAVEPIETDGITDSIMLAIEVPKKMRRLQSVFHDYRWVESMRPDAFE